MVSWRQFESVQPASLRGGLTRSSLPGTGYSVTQKTSSGQTTGTDIFLLLLFFAYFIYIYSVVSINSSHKLSVKVNCNQEVEEICRYLKQHCMPQLGTMCGLLHKHNNSKANSCGGLSCRAM